MTIVHYYNQGFFTFIISPSILKHYYTILVHIVRLVYKCSPFFTTLIDYKQILLQYSYYCIMTVNTIQIVQYDSWKVNPITYHNSHSHSHSQSHMALLYFTLLHYFSVKVHKITLFYYYLPHHNTVKVKQIKQ